MYTTWLTILLFPVGDTKIPANDSTLHVGFLLELTDYFFDDYIREFVKVFEYVFKSIHQRPDILPGFHFEMTVRDTQVCFLILI